MPRTLIPCLFLAAIGCLDAKPTASKHEPTPTAARAAAVPTRDEFKAKVMGKTQDEVIAAIGRPESTSESGGDVMWTYRDVSRDPVTGKLDGMIFLHFENGKVSSVSF